MLQELEMGRFNNLTTHVLLSSILSMRHVLLSADSHSKCLATLLNIRVWLIVNCVEEFDSFANEGTPYYYKELFCENLPCSRQSMDGGGMAPFPTANALQSI